MPNYQFATPEKNSYKFYNAVETSRIRRNHYKQDHRFAELVETLETCECHLFERGTKAVDEHGEIFIVRANGAWSCQSNHCPICQQRTYDAQFAAAISNIPAVMAKHPKSHFAHLTLSIENCLPQLVNDAIKQLTKAFTHLRRRAAFKHVYLGHVRQIEISEAQNGLAHPHLHIFLHLNSTEISEELLALLWGKALRVDYIPEIKLNFLKEDSRPLRTVIASTIAYPKKIAETDYNQSFLFAMSEIIFPGRMTTTGGTLKKILKKDYSKTNRQRYYSNFRKNKIYNAATIH